MSFRSKLHEVIRESHLTGRLFLIVEGNDDRRFIQNWLQARQGNLPSDLTVLTADGLDVDWEMLAVHDLTEGAKQRLIWAGLQLNTSVSNVRCIVDLDCGHLLRRFPEALVWWTDFPATESYGFREETLNMLNDLFLSGQLPDGNTVIHQALPALRDLYGIRHSVEDVETPKVSKGFGKQGWDVSRTVAPHISAKFPEYVVPVFEDPRSYAYGHDIAEVLMGMYPNEIKTNAKVREVSVLERGIALASIATGAFDSSPLASKIVAWLGLDSEPAGD